MTSSSPIHMETVTPGPDQVQENSYPSLRKGNGKMLCRKCLGPLEHSFTRKRTMRYTAEDGPATETVTVSVGRCLKDGHYSTIYPDEIVRNKQYCISEIRSALEDKVDFSLASPTDESLLEALVQGGMGCCGQEYPAVHRQHPF